MVRPTNVKACLAKKMVIAQATAVALQWAMEP